MYLRISFPSQGPGCSVPAWGCANIVVFWENTQGEIFWAVIRGPVKHSRSQVIPIYSIMQAVIAVKLQHAAFKKHELMSRG